MNRAWAWRLSLLANLVLAGVLFVSLRRSPPPAPVSDAATLPQVTLVTNVTKTNLVVRRQFFSWRELESNDYPTYVANLRAIGCPEPTIRDIIVEDVNDLYAQKITAEVATAEQQWWRTQPDAALQAAAVEKIRQLDAERRALLTSLLGPGWDRSLANLPAATAAVEPPAGVALTGPILGTLPAETKLLVQSIAARSEQRLREYSERMTAEGKPPDPAELERLRQQTRGELALVLSPTQLEEYLLRYSVNGTRLRDQFSTFNLSQDEFRSVFRALDPIDQQLQLLASATDPASGRRRAELEQQREQALSQALGATRYAAYQITRDPAFLQAQTAAQSAGASPEAALRLYQVNRAVEEERRRINANLALTTAERIEQLQQLAADQEKSLLALFGEAGYWRYRQGTNAPASR